MSAAAKPRTNAEARARILARMEERLKRVYPDDAPMPTRAPRTRFASFDDLEASAVRTGDAVMQDIIEIELRRALLLDDDELPERCGKCGRKLQHSVKSRTVATIRGPTTFELDHMYCRSCRKGFSPRGDHLPAPVEAK